MTKLGGCGPCREGETEEFAGPFLAAVKQLIASARIMMMGVLSRHRSEDNSSMHPALTRDSYGITGCEDHIYSGRQWARACTL